MKKEYLQRNYPTINDEEQERLQSARAAVIGCGGLGGYICESLVRCGLGHIVLADGDTFDKSNMNRQLNCTIDTIGKPKAMITRERLCLLNPDIDVTSHDVFINEDNIGQIISGCELVIDALDNIPARLVVEDACSKSNIPLIHGAVSGFTMQAALCMPGSRILHTIYEDYVDPGVPTSVVSPVVSACASFEAAEAIRFIIGQESAIKNKLMFFDIRTFESEIISF